ncbi:MAG: hypothetical protein FGM57_01950 [Candidatus Taylorbacteria bacterium]|nr:hypothetical protein [Candidatus Taylorbacteria bacterium]
MENNTSTGQSNSNTKHSLLSAQADLNTGTSFHNDPLIPKPMTGEVPVSKPLPKAVEDASAVFAERMKAEQAKSVASLQATVEKMSPTLSTTPVQPVSKPLPQTAPVFEHKSAPLTHAESTEPLNNPFTGMNTARAQAQQASSAAHKLGSNDVIFDESINDTGAPQKKDGGRAHSFILYFSILLILGLIGGGVYYWYAYMGGKDMINKSAPSPVNTVKTPTQAKPAAPVVPQSEFPAVVRQGTTTRPTQALDSAFAPEESAPVAKPTATAKKPMFGDAEKELVSSYINMNINKLSPVKSATGYAVEDVRFDGTNRALVSYSDGSMHIAAVANFTVDSKGSVRVTSFNILEK